MNSLVILAAVLAVANAGLVAHSIIAPGVVAAPAIVARGPVVHAASLGLVAHAVPVVAPLRVHQVSPNFVAHGLHGAVVAPGTGIRGQYQHDYTETLYDNGQYKGEFYRSLVHH